MSRRGVPNELSIKSGGYDSGTEANTSQRKSGTEGGGYRPGSLAIHNHMLEL